MSNKKIKVGVLGAGRGMALVNVLTSHPDAELVAICDQFEPLLMQCKKISDAVDKKIELYNSYDNFLNHDMDAVVLANYANEHAPFAIELLSSGRHVLSELMAVETLSQAVALVEAVEKSGKVYAYAENCCYYATILEMKRLYQQGEIGNFLHGEGEYIHDCESIWPRLTRGERNHWRNRMYSSFYCSHSLGPIITITGTRPVKVVGFETPNVEYMAKLGYGAGTSAMEVIQMDNNATVKSLHGLLKREPSLHWFSIYGDKGMIETDRWHEHECRIHVYREDSRLADTEINYRAKYSYSTDSSEKILEHGGSDFYPIHHFLQKITGNTEKQESIDVYQALDMSLPGLLAYRSICNGNKPIEVPDFRKVEVRDKYRNDNWCTNDKVAGENIAPLCSFGSPKLPDSIYEDVREMWVNKLKNKLF
ncbi:MAG TPA: Gfo/Idh/MocA family oxidoreductase [Clostridiales bacterium]|nr:Gfo/Idh/MocA family oxidoreductase [Clostridiales bacterium]